MKSKINLSDLFEKTIHGTTEFPVAFYDSHHIITYQWHEEDEIIYMLEGEADYHIEGEIIHLKAGECAFCPGKSLHSMLFDENRHVHFYAILFKRTYLFDSNDVCNHYFDSSAHVQYFFSPLNEKEEAFITTIQAISKFMLHKPWGYEPEVKFLLMKLFQVIYQNQLYCKMLPKEGNPEKTSVISAIQYIHNNYARKISIDELASATGYSTPYFERFFKVYTGKTPVEYILLFRLRQAQTMLKNSTGSILEISIQCGFANVSYFIRKFKMQYGKTPHQYRK